MENKMIEKLESKGFNRWTKGNMDRLYINAQAMGLTVRYHKTGTVAEAYWNGERISNGEARRMMSAKTYIDLKDGSLHSDNYWCDTLKDAAQALIDEVTAEIEAEEKAEAEKVQAVEETEAEEAREEKEENTMTYNFVIINKANAEKIGTVTTNHSISLDEAIDLLGMERLETVNSDDADLSYNGKEYWYDDLEIVLDEEFFQMKFNGLLDKCHTLNASKHPCFSLAMLDDEDIRWMAEECPSWDWLVNVTDDGGNNLYEIAKEKGYIIEDGDKVGKWSDTDIDVVCIEGSLYALNGWNGEKYLHCWKCVDRFTADADGKEYEVTPYYDWDRWNEEDEEFQDEDGRAIDGVCGYKVA